MPDNNKTNTIESSENLVQIGLPSNQRPASWLERVVSGPVADKFFALGTLFGTIGTVGYGLYLWLVLNNILPLVGSYPELKRAHVIIQLYLFFGLFVLGFVSQAGSKMLRLPLNFGKTPFLLLPLYLIGAVAMLSGQTWGRFLVSAPYAVYACYIFLVSLRNSLHSTRTVLTILGLFILAASPFLDYENPNSALLIMWGGFGSLIFSASLQFICAFLGAVPLTGKAGVLFVALHLASITILVLSPYEQAETIAFFALSALAVYLYSTAFSKWARAFYPSPLGLAFVSGFLWAALAWAILVYGSFASADLSVHILAVGWAAPIIFAVSFQVVGFITGKDYLLHPKAWWALLLIWQIVPLGRGAFHLIALPGWFSLVVAVASSIVMLAWSICICKAEWTMIRLQSSLNKGETLKSCG